MWVDPAASAPHFLVVVIIVQGLKNEFAEKANSIGRWLRINCFIESKVGIMFGTVPRETPICLRRSVDLVFYGCMKSSGLRVDEIHK